MHESEIQIIHAYTDVAECLFRSMLQQLIARVEAGTYVVSPYTQSESESRAQEVIRRMSRFVKDEEN